MQQADPWARTTSPSADPWNPVSRPAPPIAGASNVESWLSRTQSPSVSSGGASAEAWLQSNGAAPNNVLNGNQPIADPWLSKPAQQPVQDSWLKSSTPTNDTWQPPNAESKGASNGDPWAPAANMGVNLPSTFITLQSVFIAKFHNLRLVHRRLVLKQLLTRTTTNSM